MRPPLIAIAAALTLTAALSALPAQMAGAQSPSTAVLVPSSGATQSGSTYLDASATNATSVEFLLFESSTYGHADPVLVFTATLTYYGWLFSWNTTDVPNGSYVLVSEASGAGGNAFSSPISITVNNPLPTTSVLVPSSGATLSGSTYLDASASNATSVEFLLFGGPYGYAAPVVCTATATYYGWLCSWNTTTVPNGSYGLVSEASGPGGTAFSSGVSITVDNPPPSTSVIIPESGATLDSAQGYVLDAVASPGVTKVSIDAVVGSETYPVTATPTIYGWIFVAPATQPCNGVASPDCLPVRASISLQSVASYAGGVTGTSSPVDVTLIIYMLVG